MSSSDVSSGHGRDRESQRATHPRTNRNGAPSPGQGVRAPRHGEDSHAVDNLEARGRGLDVDATFLRFEKVLKQIASRSLYSLGCRSSQTTALLHDAWVKLDAKRDDIVDEKHLLALATRVLGHLAVDRHRATVRRYDRLLKVSREVELEVKPPEQGDTISRVEDLVEEIGTHSSRAAAVAKLKLFGSMSIQEIAVAMDVSERTISYDWKFARAMLAAGLKVQ